MHHAVAVVGDVIDVETEARLLVEGLGPVDVRDGQYHNFEFQIHLRFSVRRRRFRMVCVTG